MASARETTIVIPVHNEGRWLLATIEAIRYATRAPVEIVVVDDASTDGCCLLIEQHAALFKNVRIVRQQRAGIAQSRNRGAEVAETRTLVFMDAHCLPQKGWLEALLEELADGPPSVVAPAISAIGNAAMKGFGMTLKDRGFGYAWLSKENDAPYEIPIACGCCFALRRNTFWHIGGFDAMRTFGIEDVELSIRSWLFGVPVKVVPGAEVTHLFKENANFQVPWRDFLYNALRTAVLHFDGDQLARIIDHLRARGEFNEAVSDLLCSDVWERRRYVREHRTYDVEWFCRKFGITM